MSTERIAHPSPPQVIEIDLGNTPHDRLVEQFGSSLETTGFVVVTNHGIPETLIEEAYAASREVFALPDRVKLSYERIDLDHQYGFTPFGTEHSKDDPRPDLKEFWAMLRPGGMLPNIFPAEVPNFGIVATTLFRKLDVLSKHLLTILNEYLRLPSLALPEMAEGGSSMLRILHYPPIVGNPDGMRSAPHTDINLFTLLVAATASGLEIRMHDGTWVPVRNPPNAIIVNSSDMLHLFTGGRLPSMTHRVVNGDGGERFSMPFFVHARGEVVLSESPRVTAGDFLTERLKEIGVKV